MQTLYHFATVDSVETLPRVLIRRHSSYGTYIVSFTEGCHLLLLDMARCGQLPFAHCFTAMTPPTLLSVSDPLPKQSTVDSQRRVMSRQMGLTLGFLTPRLCIHQSLFWLPYKPITSQDKEQTNRSRMNACHTRFTCPIPLSTMVRHTG